MDPVANPYRPGAGRLTRVSPVVDTPLARAVDPALTCVAFEFDHYADCLADAVISAIRGETPRLTATPNPQLVIREST